MHYGHLYIVATPIGNLEDITLRALRILKEVNLIACEDTRRTRQLCNYYEIKTSLISYHEHNERQRTEDLIKRLKQGDDIAIVSDAGTPGISDPGYIVIKAAIDEGIHVVPIPGPVAFVAALVASGIDTRSFLFGGFLPRRSRDRISILDKWKFYQETIIFYVSPHRYSDVINDILKVWGEDRDVVVAREISKIHECFVRGRLGSSSILDYKPIGEVCLVISGSEKEQQVNNENPLAKLSIDQHFEFYLQEGYERKKALRQVGIDRGLSRNEVYNMLLKSK